jgi:hypothetical protein
MSGLTEAEKALINLYGKIRAQREEAITVTRSAVTIIETYGKTLEPGEIEGIAKAARSALAYISGLLDGEAALVLGETVGHLLRED